jgi:hypothetical protein
LSIRATTQGWAGFTFPILPTPLDIFRKDLLRPSSSMSLLIDGNVAHSTGWWWRQASPFYIGGSLIYNKDDRLEYNPGRSKTYFRNTCKVNPCITLRGDCARCDNNFDDWIRITNSKSFLSSGIGFVSTQASKSKCRQ